MKRKIKLIMVIGAALVVLWSGPCLAGMEQAHKESLKFFRGGNLHQAIQVLEEEGIQKIMTRKPDALTTGVYVNILNDYGFYLSETEDRYMEAISIFARVIRLSPDRAVVYLNLGDVYGKLHERSEMETCYQKYVDRLGPSFMAPERVGKLLGFSNLTKDDLRKDHGLRSLPESVRRKVLSSLKYYFDYLGRIPYVSELYYGEKKQKVYFFIKDSQDTLYSWSKDYPLVMHAGGEICRLKDRSGRLYLLYAGCRVRRGVCHEWYKLLNLGDPNDECYLYSGSGDAESGGIGRGIGNKDRGTLFIEHQIKDVNHDGYIDIILTVTEEVRVDDGLKRVRFTKIFQAAKNGFVVKEKGEPREVVVVDNVEDLLKEIASNKIIKLKAGTYNLSQGTHLEHEHFYWSGVYNGSEPNFYNLKNLTITAEGGQAKVLIEPTYADVMVFDSCANIVLDHLVIGHIEEGECVGDVLTFTDCRNIKIQDTTMFGSGAYGLVLNEVEDLEVAASTIRDCTYGLLVINNSNTVSFNHTVFSNTREFDLIAVNNSQVVFNTCSIEENYGDHLFVVGKAGNSNIRLIDCLLKENLVDDLINRLDRISIENCRFEGNSFGIPH